MSVSVISIFIFCYFIWRNGFDRHLPSIYLQKMMLLVQQARAFLHPLFLVKVQTLRHQVEIQDLSYITIIPVFLKWVPEVRHPLPDH